MKQKLGPLQQEFTDALRSGYYQQTEDELYREIDGVDCFCVWNFRGFKK